MMKKISLICLLLLVFPALASEFQSLKYDKVNMRAGPGEKFPIKWVYQEKNYPIEVLDSFELWRQVRDKEGEVGWIHQNQLSKNRYVLILKESSLFKKAGQRPIATIQPGVIARLDRCPEGDYCRLTVYSNDEKYTGWFLRSNLWGINPNEIIEK